MIANTHDSCYGVATVSRIDENISFAEYCLFYRALLQKRPILLSILLTKATPYTNMCIQIVGLYTRTHIHAHTHTHIHTRTRARTHTRTHTRTHKHTHMQADDAACSEHSYSRHHLGCVSSILHVAVCCTVLQYVAVCCSVLQCVSACCSVLQCVAVCCSV